MELKDLLSKRPKELTDVELEECVNNLKKLRLTTEKKKSTSIPKSNKEKRAESILKGLTPEQLEKIKLLLKGA